MKGVNKVILVGNTGRDPEVIQAKNGVITKLSLATSESWTDKQTGQKNEKTEWHRVVFFGRLAEIVAEYVTKGAPLYIEGQLRTSSYEKDGEKRYSTDIVAREMQMLGGKGGSNAPKTTSQSHSDAPDDDIPF